jgi:glycosyltransferase involved in cell wall biosynthesis
MIEALAERGPVDFMCVTPFVASDEAPPPDGVRVLRGASVAVSKLGRVRAWAGGDMPRALYRYDVTGGDAAVAGQLADDYDLVYISHIASWAIHDVPATGPIIVDLDNLENFTIRAARTSAPATRAPKLWAKWLAQQPVEWIDERRMERVQLRCAAAAEVVTLCSELDVGRSTMANAVMIANGYHRTVAPPTERSGSTVLFVGNLAYPPNTDAVRWFANDVLPRVRREVPDATFRVVGSGGDYVSDVVGFDGVSMAGKVDDLQPELDGAAIAVIPIRFGSGTRLKVIEALANRLPMVSTTLGSEGIGVVDGQTALLADDAPAMAAACVRLLRDGELGGRLAEAGEALWDQRYRWDQIRAEFAELAAKVAGR